MKRPNNAAAGGAFGPGKAVPQPVAERTPTATLGAPRSVLPSGKLKPPLDSPFAKPSSGATPFSSAYANGGIPCRIEHSAVKHRLQWTTPPERLWSYDPLLVLCAEGVRETLHPHTFVARTAWADLLAASGAAAKAEPLLARLIPPLRLALTSSDASVVKAGLLAVRQLVACVQGAIVQHMAPLLVPINKHDSNRLLRDEARETLLALDYCDPGALAVIKAKLPAYGRG